MASSEGTDEGEQGHHLQRVALLVWCCFIVYGSFIPFHFSANPELLRSNLAQVQLVPFQAGRKNFSLPDIASNVLLFLPFGVLLAESGYAAVGTGWARRGLITGALALLFATGIETGQLFTMGRRASGIDVESDVLGALLGCAVAFVLRRNARQVDACLRAARAEPRLVPIALVALWLGAGAFYPFAVTLDVSTLWHNLTHARWVPFRDPQGFWPDRVVDEALAFAALTALVRSALGRATSRPRAVAGALAVALAFAVALEAGKLFVVSRLPNSGNVVLASAGALGGVTLVPPLMTWLQVRQRGAQALALLALCLLVYSELTPFALDLSRQSLAAQTERIEWMPFLSYSRADAQSALFDLWRKLLLAGFWGFSLAGAGGMTSGWAACIGLLVGGVLEAAQLFLPGRVPSLGDTLVLGLGAWSGAVLHARSCGRAERSREEPGGQKRPLKARPQL
jgi:VanZ family protein